MGMVCMGIARHRDMRLDGPVGVGEWYGRTFAGLHCTDEANSLKHSSGCQQFAKIAVI